MDKRTIRVKELDKKIKELDKEQVPLIKERNELQSKIAKKETQKLLGKCFKFRNGYGSGEKWWIYIKIVKVGDWDVTVISVQDASDERVEIIREVQSASAYQEGRDYTEIPVEEFVENFESILNKIA